MRLVLAALLTLFASGAGTEERFFDWTSLQFPREEYQARRAKLAQQLKLRGGGVYLAPSRPGNPPGEVFRQLDDFLYLTGLELPDSVLLLDSENGRAIVYAPERDPRFEGEGRPGGRPGRGLAADPVLPRVAGLDGVRPLAELGGSLRELVAGGRALRVTRPGERETSLVPPFDPDAELAASLRRLVPGVRLEPARDEVARVRMVKSAAEIDVLRRAARLTARAVEAAARVVADGVDERRLEAEVEATCKRDGAQRLAFASTVKSGPNAFFPGHLLAAHYDRRNRVMRGGEVVILDVGCELDHYAGDVGRTLPVGGRFGPEQRRALQTVVEVAEDMAAALRPGVSMRDVQAAGLRRVPEPARAHLAAPSSFGHHLGLSARDPDLPDAVLEPGMVLALEPAYYDRGRGLVAFTEDALLVTATGAETLSASLARTPEGLEALVRAGRRASGRR